MTQPNMLVLCHIFPTIKEHAVNGAKNERFAFLSQRSGPGVLCVLVRKDRLIENAGYICTKGREPPLQ